jgi:hypothetical protein
MGAAQLARKVHRDLVEAVRLSQQSGERRNLVRALTALGQIERDQGRGDAVRPLYDQP